MKQQTHWIQWFICGQTTTKCWCWKSNSAFYSKDEKKRSQTTSCRRQNKTFNGKHLGQFQTSYSLPIFNPRIHGFPFATMCLQAGFNAITSYSIHLLLLLLIRGQQPPPGGGPRPAERPGSPTSGTSPEHVTRETRAASRMFLESWDVKEISE